LYFQGFAQLVKGGEVFRFEDRNRRPPRDPINAILSFLYAMLAKEFTVTLSAVGFDPMLGFFHKPRYGRPALALDITEEFRPLIAESVALSLVNTGELNEGHFIQRAGACALTESGRKILLGAYERRLDQLITHPIFGYKISYRRIFEVQCRLLGRVLLGEIAEYPNFLTR
jgi:CRISPR-associated protein Cas1